MILVVHNTSQNAYPANAIRIAGGIFVSDLGNGVVQVGGRPGTNPAPVTRTLTVIRELTNWFSKTVMATKDVMQTFSNWRTRSVTGIITQSVTVGSVERIRRLTVATLPETVTKEVTRNRTKERIVTRTVTNVEAWVTFFYGTRTVTRDINVGVTNEYSNAATRTVTRDVFLWTKLKTKTSEINLTHWHSEIVSGVVTRQTTNRTHTITKVIS